MIVNQNVYTAIIKVITSGIFVLFNEVLIQCIKANLIGGMFYILVDKTRTLREHDMP
jgi:hypothetical protein